MTWVPSPFGYSEDEEERRIDMEIILRAVSEGETLTSICDSPQFPPLRKIILWLYEFSEFFEEMRKAMKMRALVRCDELAKITAAVVAGEMPVETAKLLSGNLRLLIIADDPDRFSCFLQASSQKVEEPAPALATDVAGIIHEIRQ